MTTTATVDDRRRVRIPDAKPGQIVSIQSGPDGGWKVSPVKEPETPPKRRWTKEEVLKAIDKSPRPFTVGWDQLKEETR